jgi:hypothetical protein
MAAGAVTRERWILLAATAATAISRVFALARTPWDWDELLFMHALDRFDVAAHHPHPPGFPLYILAAKIIRKFGFGDFHALQALSVLAAILIVPAMVFLCRVLGMRFWTSLSAALILAFFPNVWFYGGGAFSDVPSMVLVIVAIALLLRGNLLLGATALAVAAGFRPQNLLIGAVPLVIASWRDKRRAPIAALILIAIVGASYAVAAWLTGWSNYLDAVREHSAYIAAVDSFRSPHRPPLWRVAAYFLVRPYRAPTINIIVTIFGTIALVRLRPHVRLALAAFVPFAIMAILYLDYYSTSRFSIGYAPLVALLVAEGIALVSWRLEPLVAAALVVIMMIWTWPALAAVRHSIAPPVAAVDWLRNHADARADTIYVHAGMIPYAEWYLREYRLRYIFESAPPAAWMLRQPGWFLREDASNAVGAQNFVRPHGRLWDLVRRRYFEVSVRPVTEHVVFGAGWYDEESSAGQVWRWMGGRSVAALPPIRGDARLTLALYAPLDALPSAPAVTIRVNGAVVDRFVPAKSLVEREIVVHARGDAVNELVIETSGVVKTPRDSRTLGLRLNALGWLPRS